MLISARSMVLGAAFCLFVSGPVAAGSEESSFSEDIERLNEFGVEQQENAETFGRGVLDKLDRQIEKLETEGEEAAADGDEAWQARKAELLELRRDVEKKLDDLGESAGDTWSDLRAATSESLRKLSDALAPSSSTD